MFWLKEYCKYFGLTISNGKIFENNNVIGKIDYYNEIVTFKTTEKSCFSDLANLIIENFPIHKEETNEKNV